MMRRMAFLEWASHNWFSLFQTAGIVGSLLFTGLALRVNVKERRNSNVLAITQAHRELWANFLKRPELSRVLNSNADLTASPVTKKEEMFILQLVVHLSTALEVLNPRRLASLDEALRKDIRWFFSLPVPKAVWEETKLRQDAGFVRFVEKIMEKDG
jgi:hypothetical protein